MRFVDYLIDETVTSTDIAVLDKKISMEKRKDVCPECGYKLIYRILGNRKFGFCKQCGYEEN